MNTQMRSELGIGYYYQKNGRVIYIPIKKGKVIEHWLKNDKSIEFWWVVEEQCL